VLSAGAGAPREGRKARGRALPAGIHRRADAHAGLPAGGNAARWTHPDGAQRAVGARGECGRKLQERRRPARDLRKGKRPRAGRRRHRVLPDRRALVAHMVRADISPRLQEGPQLRRQLDRMGERRARADYRGAQPMKNDRPGTPDEVRADLTVATKWTGGWTFDSGRPGGPTIHIDGNSKEGTSPP